MMRTRSTLWRYVVPVTAIVASLELLWVVWSGVRRGIWVDSDVYAMGGAVVRNGGDLYASLSSEGLPFTYSPFAAVSFVPLSVLDPDTARLAFTLVSIACYVLVVTVVSRRLGLPVWKAVFVGLVGLALEPMARNLMLGQINLVLMALVVCDWLLVPPRYRGYLTGVAMGIKITPAAFVVLAVMQRRWGQVARSAAGLLATVVVGLVAAPSASRTFWSGGFIGLDKFGDAVIGSDNQSLLGAWLRLTSTLVPSSTTKAVTLALGMALGLAAAFVELRRARPDSEVAALAWVATGALLGSPISWSHHWVWFVLPLMVLLSRGAYVRAGVMSLVMWYPTVWLNPPGHHDELVFSPLQRLVSCAYPVFGLVVLVGALVGALVRGRLRDPGPPDGPARPDAEQPATTTETGVAQEGPPAPYATAR